MNIKLNKSIKNSVLFNLINKDLGIINFKSLVNPYIIKLKLNN